jgi:hypothetical protein
MAHHDDPILEIWQPHSPTPLTLEDSREIAANVVGFFRVLHKWAEQDAVLAADSSRV